MNNTQKSRLDLQEFETELQLIDAVKKHFGVAIEMGEKTIWLCGSTGKRIIGITYLYSKSDLTWYIGGQIWAPDLTIDVPKDEQVGFHHGHFETAGI